MQMQVMESKMEELTVGLREEIEENEQLTQ